MLRPLVLALSVLPAAADDADLSLPFAQSSAYNTQTAFLDDVDGTIDKMLRRLPPNAKQ